MRGLDPSAKFVLIVITDCARDGVAYPSMRYIREATGYDERTVKAAVDRLIAAGLLIDTGDRVGRNRTVKVFRVDLPPQSSANKTNRSTSTNAPMPCDVPVGMQTSRMHSTPAKLPGFGRDRKTVERMPPKLQVNPVIQTNTPEDAYASSSPKPSRPFSRKSKGGPLPEDWSPPSPVNLPPSTYDKVQGWCQQRWDEEADNFRDYCFNRSGEPAVSKNWNREWAQWVRQVTYGEDRERRRRPDAEHRAAYVRMPPVAERASEGTRELELRAKVTTIISGVSCLGRCGLAIACLDPSQPFATIGLKIFARPSDRSVVDSLGPRIAKTATELGYEVRWYRVEDGQI